MPQELNRIANVVVESPLQKTFEEAHANTGWDLKQAQKLRITEPPTVEELRILREDLDPTKIYLK